MIKVHCFVSCVCELLKKRGVDHRPYYFGVWDADFAIDDSFALAYHADGINHLFFKDWYELLYGIRLHEWYEEEKTKEENIEALDYLVENKGSGHHIMVMLDLSLLPERENKFHQKPFPHYVMLEKTNDPEEWFMFDPDFRWEGRIKKNRILDAVRSPDVGGGFSFDGDQIHVPTAQTVEAYFHTCMKLDKNPLTEAVRSIVEAFMYGSEQHRLSELGSSLKQLPVLAIRKYAYEHAFAYFWMALDFGEEVFEAWCDEIESLEKGYKIVHYRAMKLAKTEKEEDYQALCDQLDKQDKLETAIKHGLHQYFTQWTQKQSQVEQIG